MNSTSFKTTIRGWLLPGLITAVISIAACVFFARPLIWSDLIAGWLAALFSAAAARWLNRRAVGARMNRFLWLAVGGNLLRLVLLIAMIAFWMSARHGLVRGFLIAVLTGYFVFMLAEIGELRSGG